MNWILENAPAWNSWLALGLYWLPMALCLAGYAARAAKEIRQDVIDRLAYADGSSSYYSPTVTVGRLIGFVLLALIPIANLGAAAFDLMPWMLGKFFRWLEVALDIPLVPKRPRQDT